VWPSTMASSITSSPSRTSFLRSANSSSERRPSCASNRIARWSLPDTWARSRSHSSRVCARLDDRFLDFAFSLRAGFRSIIFRSTAMSRMARRYRVSLESRDLLESFSTYSLTRRCSSASLKSRIGRGPNLPIRCVSMRFSLERTVLAPQLGLFRSTYSRASSPKVVFAVKAAAAL
jgi:hypothetical protein